MNLENYIATAFPDGLTYTEAAQLCLRLYCTVDGIPQVFHSECSKDGLAETFARLCQRGFLTTEPLTATMYGARFHAVTEKGHWIEVIASLLKIGNTRDPELGELVAHRLMGGGAGVD
jgi:hypothetical protein